MRDEDAQRPPFASVVGGSEGLDRINSPPLQHKW